MRPLLHTSFALQQNIQGGVVLHFLGWTGHGHPPLHAPGTRRKGRAWQVEGRWKIEHICKLETSTWVHARGIFMQCQCIQCQYL